MECECERTMKPFENFKKRQSYDMSIQEEIILDLIGENEMGVMEVIAVIVDENVASVSTAHINLMKLKKKSYITIKPNRFDGRTKVCKITPVGKQYLEDL